METSLSVEVHCLGPRWVNFEDAKYRLYVNNDLLTERTWRWGIDAFVKENIIVDVPTELANDLYIMPILEPKSTAQFVLKNLKVEEDLIEDLGGHRTQVSFIVPERLNDDSINIV